MQSGSGRFTGLTVTCCEERYSTINTLTHTHTHTNQHKHIVNSVVCGRYGLCSLVLRENTVADCYRGKAITWQRGSVQFEGWIYCLNLSELFLGVSPEFTSEFKVNLPRRCGRDKGLRRSDTHTHRASTQRHSLSKYNNRTPQLLEQKSGVNHSPVVQCC